MDKLKIFVRYEPGAGGHFISLLILSLVIDIEIKEKWRGHTNINDINHGHNFETQWTPEFRQYTGIEINLDESIQWIKKNFKFYDIDNPLYVIHTHCDNPEPLLKAFTNTKLINIIHQDENINQMAYNWVIKSCLYHNQWRFNRGKLKYIQTNFNRLNDLPLNEIDLIRDLKLCTYLQKFGTLHNNYAVNNSNDVFNITFNDIMTGKLIEQLDDIIKFLNIEVNDSRKSKVVKMIEEYASSQRLVPWKLTIEEYE
jgi:hypothetical protein